MPLRGCLKNLFLLLGLLLGWPLSVEAVRQVIAAPQAQEFVDQKVVVQGRVTATRTDGRNTFLVLGSPSQPDLTVALTPPLLLSGFPDNPDAFYQGKTVRVRGTVYLFQGTPEILVRHASFIKVVKDKNADKNAERDQQNEPAEERVGTFSQDVSNLHASHPSHFGLPLSPTPILPRERVTGNTGSVLDMRTVTAEGDGRRTALETSACGEAQGLWQQVSHDLIPHLRAYTRCLEKGSLGCDSEGEKVALGMLGVQQAQKRIRITCD
jgi:hypothetical protein